jgi:hypothetical protein
MHDQHTQTLHVHVHKPGGEGSGRQKETNPGEGNRSPDLQGPVAPSPRRRQTCQVALGKANIGGTLR